MVLPEMDGFLNQFVHETHVFFSIFVLENEKKKENVTAGVPRINQHTRGRAYATKILGQKRFRLRE